MWSIGLLAILPLFPVLVQSVALHIFNDFPNWRIAPVTSFESDIMVPVGYDPHPCYWNVAGFGTGYCGFQTWTETERVLIFSVWDLSHHQKAQVINVGQNVTYEDFYEGGAGKHAFMHYDWKAGETYRIRVDAEYSGNDTIFTSSLKVGDEWRLFASIRGNDFGHYDLRAGTGIYQFIENFGNNGTQTRRGLFSRQCYRILGSDFCYPNWGGYTTRTAGGGCWGSGIDPSGGGLYLAIDGNQTGTENCNHETWQWLQYDNCAMDKLTLDINGEKEPPHQTHV
ncbi:hypothetical protein K7432_012970 [Basidiobolus ranarum]|uniref:DUF5077 domain-containing protein n=1 Tax=Basidiobolus ranarum TaxID=34480 RepID=A0ABR2WJY6_9FUNG